MQTAAAATSWVPELRNLTREHRSGHQMRRGEAACFFHMEQRQKRKAAHRSSSYSAPRAPGGPPEPRAALQSPERPPSSTR